MTAISRDLETVEYDSHWSREEYSAATNGYTPHFLRFMKVSVPSSHSEARALEIGCGDGFFSAALQSNGFAVHGVDLSPVAIELANQRLPDGDFRVHDLGTPLPFDDHSFDVVWCSEVLEHLFSPLFVCREANRVLKPGGRMLVTVPFHGLIKNLGIALFAFDKHYDFEYPHIRFFTKNSMATMLSKAGFKVASISTCGSNLGLRDWICPTNLLAVGVRE